MTSPSDDHAPQDIPVRTQHQPANQSLARPRIVTRVPQLDESGFLVSGWGTAIFLLIGLSMMAGLAGASYWLIQEAEVIAKSDLLSAFQTKHQASSPQSQFFNPVPHPTPPRIHPASQPAKPSGQRPRRPLVPVFPQGTQPLPELTSDERTLILASLHPRESNDERTKDIRNGFSIENIIASQRDPEDCLRMTEVIGHTLSVNGQAITLQTNRFYHPTLHLRIREQLPPDILARSRLHFELKYLARVSARVRVAHVERYNDDTERTAFCHIGDHSEYAFRYELVRVGPQWYVIDMESIDAGLSLSEVVALSETLNVLFPQEKGQLYAMGIHLANSGEGGDVGSRAARYRKYLMEKVPNPLRDFYLSVTAGVEDKFWGASPRAIHWVSDVENLDRFISVHRLRMDLARNEGKPHDVVLHGERYIARAGNACPPVVRNYAEALIQIGRVPESLKFLNYLLTLDRNDEATLQMLAIHTADPDVRKQLAPLLEEFELNEMSSPTELDMPSSTDAPGCEPKDEAQAPDPLEP